MTLNELPFGPLRKNRKRQQKFEQKFAVFSTVQELQRAAVSLQSAHSKQLGFLPPN